MKILVAIASYGTQNDQYLGQLLAEYRSMPFEVDIVVLSNLSKNLGPGVEVKVGLPTKDPWSLPFGHKQLFADRLAMYDLFIYSEDDMLVSERNIRAFLAATEVLNENEIAGFLRTEVGSDGKQYFCDAFDQWHWDSASVRSRGNYTFAFFTNEHSAFYILTKGQLKRAIDSGGFLIGPREGKYDLLCTAATDPYTQCGLKKLICISNLDDFLVAHLSNKYVGVLSLKGSEFLRQIAALMAINQDGRPHSQLFETGTRLPSSRWSKSYYEPCRSDVLDLIPPGVKSVLSVGCGWGAAEGCLAQKGIRVVGIPLDSVISACAEARGVEIVHGNFKSALEKLAGQQFDYVLMSNILHLIEDPINLLSSFVNAISGDFQVIALVPNLSRLSGMVRRIRSVEHFKHLGSYEKTGVHVTSRRVIQEWLKAAGLRVEGMIDVMPSKAQKARRLTFGLADALLASEFIAVGRKM
jgi:2-polyprenyl-3-methyl-5-hydroxy-6-metoxy-1,4-benzoquinol methylase